MRRCEELLAMRRLAAGPEHAESTSISFVDLPQDQARVCKDLRLLPKRYEAVLYHSGQTMRMLRALNQNASADRNGAQAPGDSSTGGLSWLA